MTIRFLLLLATAGLLLPAACQPNPAPVEPTDATDERTTAETDPSPPEPNESTDPPPAPAESEPQPTPGPTPEIDYMTTDDRSDRLRRITADWNTNWNKHTIEYDEILSGGPPRDGIPSIDDPQFVNIDTAEEWLADREPVVVVEEGDEARAYPIQILTWHEIVNDEFNGRPLLVTFCPLCNAAIVFDRTVGDEVYEFGVSGLLRNSDMIMYDRTTESLWQQFLGTAVVGDEVGRRLEMVSSTMVSFETFKEAHPEGEVLSRETGHTRRYGQNPYVGYDTIDGRDPFLFDGEIDRRLPAVERVVAVTDDNIDADVAYPFGVLAEEGAVNDDVDGTPIVVFHAFGTNTAMGAASIAEAEDIGAAAVYERTVDGRTLTFERDGDTFIDAETGSTWTILGRAVDGELAGTQLEPVIHGTHFWFAWAAFKPETEIYGVD